MAGNLWLWLRLIAVSAASFIWAFTVAYAQTENVPTPQTEPVKPQLSKTALRDLRLVALAGPASVGVQWRYVSDGKTVKQAPERVSPEMTVNGLRTDPGVFSSFSDQRVESLIVVVVSGKASKEVQYYYETARAAIAALPAAKYRLMIGGANPDLSWIADDPVPVLEDVNLDYGSFVSKGDPAGTQALVKAFSDTMAALKQAHPQSRAALIAPQSLFPDDTGLLTRLAGAAFAQRISFFPMAPPGGVSQRRAQQMIDTAGPTAGRFMPDALTGRTLDQRLALFSEFLGGGNAVYAIDRYHQYRLPTEKVKPVELIINYGDLTDTLVLNHARPVLKGAALKAAFVDPRHWMRWLVDPARWPYGLAALTIWTVILAGIYRLLVPPIKLFVQIAGEEKVHKIRRLPAVIGRGAQARIHLDDEAVSREHAELKKQNGVFTLTDLGSSNGIWIAGERVKSISLKRIQTVQFGPYKLILRLNVGRGPVKALIANRNK